MHCRGGEFCIGVDLMSGSVLLLIGERNNGEQCDDKSYVMTKVNQAA